VFSTACGADDRPLTLPVAPRSTWKPKLCEEPGPLLPPSRQRPRLSRPRASSIDRVPPAGSLSRVPAIWGPATDLAALPPTIRLPALVRHFELSRELARPDVVVHELFARGRDGPNAACRLLQPLRPASTTAVRPNPTRPPFWSPRRAALSPQLPHRSPSFARVATHLSMRSQSRVTGQGPPEAAKPLRSAPPQRDRSRGELCPNPIGSDTSCRMLVTTLAGERQCRQGVALCRDSFVTSLPSASSLSRRAPPLGLR
jgi:hypothetical protein